MKLSHAIAGAALGAAIVIVSPAFADDASQKSAALEQQGSDDTAAMVEKGKQIYAQHCSHCHGFNMVSAGNVTFDLRTFPHDQKDRFLESVVNGKDRLMPPWGDVLSLDELNDVWAYILTGGKG